MARLSQFELEGIEFVHTVDERPRDESFPMHMHDHYEIFCFVSGKAAYMVEGNLYELRPGTVLLMRSTETHKLFIESDERYERYTISFYPERLTARGMPRELLTPFTARGLGEKNVYSAEDFGEVGVLELLRKTEEECRTITPAFALYPNLTGVLTALLRVFASYPAEDRLAKDKEPGRELLHYINDHITEPLTLDGLSAHMHISAAQLNRLFKALTGTTVYQYILSKRLVLAQRQMMKGKSAAQAAKDCGFGDYSCFFRMYKNHFGVSPRTVRETVEQLIP